MSYVSGGISGNYLDVGVPLTRWDDPNKLLVQGNSLARNMAVYANAGLTTRTAVGMPDLTPAGTVTAASDIDGAWHNHATTAVANNAAGIVSPFTLLQRAWSAELGFKVKTDPAAITTTRLLVGAFSASPDTVPTPVNIHGAYFRYDTSVAGETTWKACTAAGGAPTVIDTGVPVVANSPYLLIIQLYPGSWINFVVMSALTSWKVTTATATLPTATTPLGIGARVTTLSAAIRNVKWARATVCHV